MANSWRISALAERHRALGSKLEDWSGMGTAWTYASDLADEHEAIRTRAGLMDVSGLKKVHYVGPHAESLLEYATSRDISKVYPGKSVYATMLNEAGKFVDDCVIYRTGPNAFMVVHGSGSGHEMLVRSAQGRQDDRRRHRRPETGQPRDGVGVEHACTGIAARAFRRCRQHGRLVPGARRHTALHAFLRGGCALARPGLIVAMGGPMSVNDESELPWLIEENGLQAELCTVSALQETAILIEDVIAGVAGQALDRTVTQ